MVEWQGRHDRMLVDCRMAVGSCGAGQSGICGDDPARFWRRSGTRRSVLRAGQLVSRRRGSDVVHCLALWRAEPGATNVSADDFPRRFDSRIEVLRSVAAVAAVDWSQALRHLPENEIIKAVDGPHGIFADKMPVDTGGAMIERAPNDPAWYKGGLWHDNMKIKVPGFWFMSWYDVSVGPNLAVYNQVRKTARPEVAAQQYAIIAPTLHCSYKRAAENTVVGERSVGDARLDYDALTYGWFDYFLKGEDNHLLEKTPKVRYYTMGMNKWQTSDTWPPKGAQPMTLFLSSGGKANTLNGDGV